MIVPRFPPALGCNWDLLKMADYEDEKRLMLLFKNLLKLREHAKDGDSVACCIYADLMGALESDAVTEKQRDAIYLVCIMGYTQWEAGKIMGIEQQSMHQNVWGGVNNIKKILSIPVKTPSNRPI